MSAEIHGGAEDGFGPVVDAFAAAVTKGVLTICGYQLVEPWEGHSVFRSPMDGSPSKSFGQQIFGPADRGERWARDSPSTCHRLSSSSDNADSVMGEPVENWPSATTHIRSGSAVSTAEWAASAILALPC